MDTSGSSQLEWDELSPSSSAGSYREDRGHRDFGIVPQRVSKLIANLPSQTGFLPTSSVPAFDEADCDLVGILPAGRYVEPVALEELDQPPESDV